MLLRIFEVASILASSVLKFECGGLKERKIASGLKMIWESVVSSYAVGQLYKIVHGMANVPVLTHLP